MRKKVASATVTPCDVLSADVLILGGGLAGLRAALAATAAQPGCRVAVVTAGDGPAGSSFANPNNAWGMQVCTSEAEVRAMVREILELAAPGRVEPRLAELVAAESLARFSDLRDLGVRFEAEPGEGRAGPSSSRIWRTCTAVFAGTWTGATSVGCRAGWSARS